MTQQGSRRGRKRAHTSASALPPLPTYVALLHNLSIAIEPEHHHGNKPVYALEVRQLKSSCSCESLDCSCQPSSPGSPSKAALPSHWRRELTLDDYTAFYRRLLDAMQHGHFCNAECPFIYSFVKSYFPKKSVFQRNSSARTIASRRDALDKCLHSLLTFLMDRNNHSCAVATTAVAKVFAEFAYGGESALPAYIMDLRATFNSSERWQSNNSFLGSQRPPSIASLSDDDMSDAPECCGVCSNELCYGPNGPQDDSEEDSSARRRSFYSTALGCGHQFHDECIVPVLNDTMRCPVCNHQEITC